MKPLKCMIVDNDPLGITLMKEYIKRIDFLELGGVCDTAKAAENMVKKDAYDLVFLNIHLSGFSNGGFLKLFTKGLCVILLAEDSNNAFIRTRANALDCLLKPTEFKSFYNAVNRAKEWVVLKDSWYGNGVAHGYELPNKDKYL